MQNQLNVIESQSRRLGLEVNLNKTKIVVFRKGGFLSKNELWHFGNTRLPVVNSYKYLGMEFSTKLSFVNSTEPFIVTAKKACCEILRSLNNLNCYNLDVFLRLFDSKVCPILSYASELWGYG